MLLKVNDIDVTSYEEIHYKYNNKIYYTFKYNNEFIMKSGDKIEFICKCRKNVIKKYYPTNKHIQLLCTNCKQKQTLKEKYGVENISQLDSIKKKKKQTIKERYGVENISQLDSIKEKKKQTMISHYGNNNPLSLKKTKQTIKERYGVENVNKDKKIRNKIKETCLKKYGYTSVLADKNKMKKANLKKNGYENYNNRNKAKQTNFKKYGSEAPFSWGSNNQIQLTLEKTYNKFLSFNSIKPLFTLDEYLEKQHKYDKFVWECKTCHTQFKDYYANGKKPRCPICYPKLNGYSRKEKELTTWCKTFTTVIENNRSIIKPYEIDIYLPNYKLAIEYNGLYYHSTKFKLDKWYHQKKVELAYRKGIRLLHVWEYEDIDDVKNIIKYYINNIDEYIEIKKPRLYNIDDNLIWI